MAIDPDVLREGTTPPGEWDVFAEDVSIVGERFRLKGCSEFVAGLSNHLADGPFGVRLEREPTNEHDSYAIKVMGYWSEKGWLSSKRHERHIGYIPSKLAYSVGKNIEPHEPLAACLVAVEVDIEAEDPLNIVIDILEAP